MQVNYVHTDCNDILVQIRLAFKHGNTELEPQHAVAKMADITLPTDFDEAALLGASMPALSFSVSELPPINMDTSYSIHQVRTRALVYRCLQFLVTS